MSPQLKFAEASSQALLRLVTLVRYINTYINNKERNIIISIYNKYQIMVDGYSNHLWILLLCRSWGQRAIRFFQRSSPHQSGSIEITCGRFYASASKVECSSKMLIETTSFVSLSGHPLFFLRIVFGLLLRSPVWCQ